MSKISDEIRKWCADLDSDDVLCTTATLYILADRIDAEMVELPRDRDGVPIHVDDTVYLDDMRSAKVIRIDIEPANPSIVCSTCDRKNGGYPQNNWYPPSDLTHENPDSFERIADELEAWCNSVDGDACEKPRDLADRIRKLAAKEDE